MEKNEKEKHIQLYLQTLLKEIIIAIAMNFIERNNKNEE